ncbi:MAG: tetratricopeptide repeat protein [Planctomycetota bacterium]|jgi:tetratricopeptide (TPR) repeat protein
MSKGPPFPGEEGVSFWDLTHEQIVAKFDTHTAVIEDPESTPTQRINALMLRGQIYEMSVGLEDFEAIVNDPDATPDQRAEAMIHQGWIYAHHDFERYDEAVELFTRVIETPGVSVALQAEALDKRAATYGWMEPSQDEKAKDDILAAAALPGAPIKYRSGALLYLANHNAETDVEVCASINTYTQIIEMPGVPVDHLIAALMYRGYAYEELEPPETEKAITDYTTVIDMPDDPDDFIPNACYSRGDAYGRLNPPRLQQKINDLTKAIDCARGSYGAHEAMCRVERGYAYRELDPPLFDNALADYNRVIDHKETSHGWHAEALLGRGTLEHPSITPHAAEADLKEALRLYQGFDDDEGVTEAQAALDRLT